jgi:DNA-binding NtrC family response regulator
VTQTPAKPLANILLVDDDQIILESLGGFLRLEGYDITLASSASQAMDHLQAGTYDLIISDVNMPGKDGLDLLKHIHQANPQSLVIMITGYGTIESAVEAIKQGAYDYLTKPIIDDDVKLAIQRALRQKNLQAENSQLRQTLSQRFGLGNIVGQDYRMSKVFDLVTVVADTRTTVLITGESGTGKSIIARAIHAQSSRSGRPFIEVACGAMPDSLLESELFGHVRGSFTGAVGDKEGKFAAADGGTIFLDEISTASASLQVKLLRVLQERQFEPVGSNQTREVDVRVVLASNHDLEQEVKAGHFRGDLYYRINVVNIALPPLRNRLGDIPLLAGHFLKKFDTDGRISDGISQAAMKVMQLYAWPGNVRELENCMERAVVLCPGSIINPDDLPPAVGNTAGQSQAGSLVSVGGGADARSLQDALAGPERRIILAALLANNGSRRLAAEQLGINRCTLYKKMRKYNLFGDV